MLKIDNIQKSFKGKVARSKGEITRQQVLCDVSLDVAEGEFVSLLGASGCGKTTLLRMIAGLIKPDSGTIFANDRAIVQPRKDICMVFQNFGLLPWLTVLANVAFPLELDGVGKSEREASAQTYIKLVNLAGFENHYPHELSGGMQQRVGIARALVRQPILLLMDEPFAALDAQTREQLQGEFLSIWAQLKTTIVFVTHSIDEALVLSDKIVLLNSSPGRVAKVLASPVAPYRLSERDVRTHPDFATQSHNIREFLRTGQYA